MREKSASAAAAGAPRRDSAARSRGEASGGGGSAGGGGAEPNECAEEAEVAAVGGHGKRADKLLRALGFVPKIHPILQVKRPCFEHGNFRTFFL